MKILSRNFIAQYAFTVVVFLSLDSLWIYFVARHMYMNMLSPILAPQPGWVAALCFYLVYSFGLWFLAIKPSNKASDAALRGAILGLTAYGTYALTGQSLFAGWEWSLTLADCAWGAILTGTVAYLTRKVL